MILLTFIHLKYLYNLCNIFNLLRVLIFILIFTFMFFFRSYTAGHNPRASSTSRLTRTSCHPTSNRDSACMWTATSLTFRWIAEECHKNSSWNFNSWGKFIKNDLFVHKGGNFQFQSQIWAQVFWVDPRIEHFFHRRKRSRNFYWYSEILRLRYICAVRFEVWYGRKCKLQKNMNCFKTMMPVAAQGK